MSVVVEYGDYSGTISDFEENLVLTDTVNNEITLYHFKVVSVGAKRVHIWHSGEILYTLDFSSSEKADLLEVTGGYIGALVYNILKKDLEVLVFSRGSVVCSNCGSKIHNKYWQKRGNINDAYIQMMCPVCRKVSTVATEGLRDYINEPIEESDIHKVKPVQSGSNMGGFVQDINMGYYESPHEYSPFKMGDEYDSGNKHRSIFSKRG